MKTLEKVRAFPRAQGGPSSSRHSSQRATVLPRNDDAEPGHRSSRDQDVRDALVWTESAKNQSHEAVVLEPERVSCARSVDESSPFSDAAVLTVRDDSRHDRARPAAGSPRSDCA